MNITGIIAEYNPFHYGHKYQIEMARKNGATHIIVCMSGNYTQRGEFACFNKFTKAKAATFCGADLVLELPTPYALSSADRFAFGAVSILNDLGCVDNLHFGSECGDIDTLINMAEIVDSSLIIDETNNILKSGMSYPMARQHAISLHYPKLSKHFISPNNTLGTEYIKWISRFNSKITPTTIKRHKVSHDSEKTDGLFASASYIRGLIDENKDDALSYIPKAASKLFKQDILDGYIPNSKSINLAVLSKLRTITREELLTVADVSEGLENRILTSTAKATDLNQLYELIKTKRYTMARIRRIILNAFLGIPKWMQAAPPPYARVLTFNKKGQEILKLAKKTSSLYVSASLSSIRDKCPDALPYVLMEAKATDMYALCTNTIQPCSSDFVYKIKGASITI